MQVAEPVNINTTHLNQDVLSSLVVNHKVAEKDKEIKLSQLQKNQKETRLLLEANTDCV